MAYRLRWETAFRLLVTKIAAPGRARRRKALFWGYCRIRSAATRTDAFAVTTKATVGVAEAATNELRWRPRSSSILMIYIMRWITTTCKRGSHLEPQRSALIPESENQN